MYFWPKWKYSKLLSVRILTNFGTHVLQNFSIYQVRLLEIDVSLGLLLLALLGGLSLDQLHPYNGEDEDQSRDHHGFLKPKLLLCCHHSLTTDKEETNAKSCTTAHTTFSSSRLNPIYLISDGVIQGHKWEIFPAEDLWHLEMCSWSFSHCFGFDFTAWVLLLSENCAQWSRVTAGESGEGGTGKGPAT